MPHPSAGAQDPQHTHDDGKQAAVAVAVAVAVTLEGESAGRMSPELKLGWNEAGVSVAVAVEVAVGVAVEVAVGVAVEVAVGVAFAVAAAMGVAGGAWLLKLALALTRCAICLARFVRCFVKHFRTCK